MKLRPAGLEDVEAVMRVMDAGRRAQRIQGFVQWADGYPDAAVIRADILSGAGRLLVAEDGDIAGYAALVEFDAGYDSLGDDVWHYGGGFAVVHRMAVADAYRGKGLSDIFFGLLEAEAAGTGVGALRVDTGVENRVMQHILSRRGYRDAGVQAFPWGERIAYEKRIQSAAPIAMSD